MNEKWSLFSKKLICKSLHSKNMKMFYSMVMIMLIISPTNWKRTQLILDQILLINVCSPFWIVLLIKQGNFKFMLPLHQTKSSKFIIQPEFPEHTKDLLLFLLNFWKDCRLERKKAVKLYCKSSKVQLNNICPQMQSK